MKKLFTNLDLDSFNNETIQEAYLEDLDTSLLYLTFRYKKRRKIIFYKLHLKVLGKSIDLLKGTAIKDSNGVESFYIGQFTQNTIVEISFGIMAMTSIPKIVAIISQDNPKLAFQAMPKSPGETYSINTGERWEKTIKYTIL